MMYDIIVIKNLVFVHPHKNDNPVSCKNLHFEILLQKSAFFCARKRRLHMDGRLKQSKISVLENDPDTC